MELRASSIASLSPSKRQAFLDSLDEDELLALEHDWHFWARDDQLAPPGLWRIWLALAGRGWGKTRVGAEWCHERAQASPCRIAIVAANKEDAEKVCVLGDSGIMATGKPWFPPHFAPAKSGGQVSWPNGSIAELYSGDNPQSLRGPQFHAAWCFPAGTPVAMADGSSKPIDQVAVGDFVLTRSGGRRVLASALTCKEADLVRLSTVDGRAVFATPNHPVLVEGRGWTPMASLNPGDIVCALPFDGAVAPGTRKRLGTTQTTMASAFIAQSIASITDLFRPGTTSTTKTKTRATTTLSILRRCRRQSTASSTGPASASVLASSTASGRGGRGANAALPRSSALAAARALDRALSFLAAFVHRCAWNAFAPYPSFLGAGSASSAALATRQSVRRRSFALSAATTRPTSPAPVSFATDLVRSAGAASSRSAPTLGFVGASAPSTSTLRLAVASVERCARRAPVYDIAVEGAPEFFANGILVHNCDELLKWRRMQAAWDMLRFGLRLGTDPRTVITSTPTPAKLLKELVKDTRIARDGSALVRVTRGSTYANAANLAQDFLDELKAKYEGTRLGRQELYAEILEDKPGALWTLLRIEEHRKAEHPDLRRVVVAIDPPLTSGEDADECGIICAGHAVDGHGYVLADGSERGLSPKQWAEKALGLYVMHKADCIVAEANNGGEMITQVIRNLDANVPVKLVYASRGKVTRAEPVSNLYEQGRVHHVGVFKALEDQQCDFTTDFDRKTAGYSPDRVDALVWAITELMLTGRTGTLKAARW